MTHLSSFASLNKDYLKPHDTIHAIVKAGDHCRGVVDLTWASPTQSTPQSSSFVITGSSGWLAIKSETVGDKSVQRLTIKSVREKDGKADGETEEISEMQFQGVEVELKCFFAAITGKSGEALGEPRDALQDVAFIQAALNSEGNLISLADLIKGK